MSWIVLTCISFLWILCCSQVVCVCYNYSLIHEAAHDDMIFSENVLFEGSVVRADCATICGLDVQCWSFFYSLDTETCQTHSVIFVEATGNASIGKRYYRKPTECGVGPDIANSVKLFNPTEEPYETGAIISYDCDTGRFPTDDVVCLISGNWSTMDCKRPSNCAEVQICQPGSPDGEYWLYPPTFGGNKARIYCHEMSSQVPKEYVTLVNSNSGHYPNLDNGNCAGQRTAGNKGGNTTFTKIRVSTETMVVTNGDYQFATSTDKFHKWGAASDCYTNHGANKASCGTRGRFTMDTQGTGMILDTQITWAAYGWMPWAEFTRSNNGLVVNLFCGGYCGGCRADRPLVLQYYAAQEPALGSATTLTCDG